MAVGKAANWSAGNAETAASARQEQEAVPVSLEKPSPENSQVPKFQLMESAQAWVQASFPKVSALWNLSPSKPKKASDSSSYSLDVNTELEKIQSLLKAHELEYTPDATATPKLDEAKASLVELKAYLKKNLITGEPFLATYRLSADVYDASRDYGQALADLEHIKVYHPEYLVHGYREVLKNLMGHHRELGKNLEDFEQREFHLQEAHRIAEILEDGNAVFDIELAQVRLLVLKGDNAEGEEAEFYYASGLEQLMALDEGAVWAQQSERMAKKLPLTAKLMDRMGEYGAALSCWEKLSELYVSQDLPTKALEHKQGDYVLKLEEIAGAALAEARMALEQEDWTQAGKLYGEALKIYRALNSFGISEHLYLEAKNEARVFYQDLNERQKQAETKLQEVCEAGDYGAERNALMAALEVYASLEGLDVQGEGSVSERITELKLQLASLPEGEAVQKQYTQDKERSARWAKLRDGLRRSLVLVAKGHGDVAGMGYVGLITELNAWIENYEASAESKIALWELHELRAQVFASLNQFNSAAQDFSQAAQLSPKAGESFTTYQDQLKAIVAQTYFQLELPMAPEEKLFIVTQALEALEVLLEVYDYPDLENKKQFKAQEASLKKIIEQAQLTESLRPKTPQEQYQMALQYWQEGQIVQAQAAWEKVVMATEGSLHPELQSLNTEAKAQLKQILSMQLNDLTRANSMFKQQRLAQQLKFKAKIEITFEKNEALIEVFQELAQESGVYNLDTLCQALAERTKGSARVKKIWERYQKLEQFDGPFAAYLKQYLPHGISSRLTIDSQRQADMELGNALRTGGGSDALAGEVYQRVFAEVYAEEEAKVLEEQGEEIQKQFEQYRYYLEPKIEAQVKRQLSRSKKENPKAFYKCYPKGWPSESQIEKMQDNIWQELWHNTVHRRVLVRLEERYSKCRADWYLPGGVKKKHRENFAALPESEQIQVQAYFNYDDMLDPLDKTLNLSDEAVRQIVDEVIITAVATAISAGSAGMIRSGALRGSELALQNSRRLSIFTPTSGTWLNRLGQRGQQLWNGARRMPFSMRGSYATNFGVDNLLQSLTTADMTGESFDTELARNTRYSIAFDLGGFLTRAALGRRFSRGYFGLASTLGMQTVIGAGMSYGEEIITGQATGQSFWERLGHSGLRMGMGHGMHKVAGTAMKRHPTLRYWMDGEQRRAFRDEIRDRGVGEDNAIALTLDPASQERLRHLSPYTRSEIHDGLINESSLLTQDQAAQIALDPLTHRLFAYYLAQDLPPDSAARIAVKTRENLLHRPPSTEPSQAAAHAGMGMGGYRVAHGQDEGVIPLRMSGDERDDPTHRPAGADTPIDPFAGIPDGQDPSRVWNPNLPSEQGASIAYSFRKGTKIFLFRNLDSIHRDLEAARRAGEDTTSLELELTEYHQAHQRLSELPASMKDLYGQLSSKYNEIDALLAEHGMTSSAHRDRGFEYRDNIKKVADQLPEDVGDTYLRLCSEAFEPLRDLRSLMEEYQGLSRRFGLNGDPIDAPMRKIFETLNDLAFYGPTVSFNFGFRPNTKALVLDKMGDWLGREITLKELESILPNAGLGGGVSVGITNDNHITIRIKHSFFNEFNMVLKKTDEGVIFDLDRWKVSKAAPSGSTLACFKRMAEGARQLGITKFTADHMSGAKGRVRQDIEWVGYYVWPTYGFDGKLYDPEGNIFANQPLPEALSKTEAGAEVTTLHQLYALPGGRKWWKEHGRGQQGEGDESYKLKGEFDLSEGSQSWERLLAYEAERAARDGQAHPSEPTNEPRIDQIVEAEWQDGFPSLVNPTQPYQIDLPTGESKHVRFLSKDNWSSFAPPLLNNKNFQIAIPVNNVSEGFEIFNAILKKTDLGFGEVHPTAGQAGIDINNKIHVSVIKVADAPGGIESVYELKIEFINEASPDTGLSLLRGLTKLGLKSLDADKVEYDFTSNSGRREWAYYSFYAWVKSLSPEEKSALAKVSGGPNYKTIHEALRSGDVDSAPVVRETVGAIDSAIAKGKVDREITVHRAIKSDSLEGVWDRLHGGEVQSIDIDPDPAYVFTSLDPKMAQSWQKTELNGEGILLEIKVPKGFNAAFMDTDGIQFHRGYLEILLPRNTAFKAIGARTNAQGKKVLILEPSLP